MVKFSLILLISRICCIRQVKSIKVLNGHGIEFCSSKKGVQSTEMEWAT